MSLKNPFATIPGFEHKLNSQSRLAYGTCVIKAETLQERKFNTLFLNFEGIHVFFFLKS